jgi:hypothetical protein
MTGELFVHPRQEKVGQWGRHSCLPSAGNRQECLFYSYGDLMPFASPLKIVAGGLDEIE